MPQCNTNYLTKQIFLIFLFLQINNFNNILGLRKQLTIRKLNKDEYKIYV